VLAALGDTWNASDWVEQLCIFIVFGVGAGLTFIEWLGSVGAAAARSSILVLAIFSLSLAMYFDIVDSEGLVG